MENSEIIQELERINDRVKKIEERYENLENFYHEIKKIVREKGKSDFIKRERIEELIVKYGG